MPSQRAKEIFAQGLAKAGRKAGKRLTVEEQSKPAPSPKMPPKTPVPKTKMPKPGK